MPESHPGDWRRYRAGCHCTPCRAANAAYAKTRVGTVDAAPARAHLLTLQRSGIGTLQAARLAGVSHWTILRVITGKAPRLRAHTAARILGARPVLAHGALIVSTRTHRYLDSLVREGFTHRALAFHLGHHSQQLQLNTHPVMPWRGVRRPHTRRPPTTPRQIRVATALRVATLYDRLAAEPCLPT